MADQAFDKIQVYKKVTLVYESIWQLLYELIYENISLQFFYNFLSISHYHNLFLFNFDMDNL